MRFSLRNRAAAWEWMGDPAPTPALEGAYTLYLVGTAKEDPEGALALVAHIKDPARRAKVQRAAGRAWLKSDATAAEAWLESADLSPAVREAILQPRIVQRGLGPGGS